MRIEVERRIRGHDLRREIIERHGTRDALVAHAGSGDPTARDDLFHLDLLAEDPSRLEDEFTIGHITILGVEDVSRLTPARLRLLNQLTALGSCNLSELQQALDRDIKRVSTDVRILEDLGLIQSWRHGRDKVLRPLGNDIHIDLSSRAAA